MLNPSNLRHAAHRNGGSGVITAAGSSLVAPTDQGNPPPFSPSLELTFRGHRSTVLAAGFRPTVDSHFDPHGCAPWGRKWPAPCILSGGSDGYVFMWSARPTVRALRFVGHNGSVRDCTWSSQGQLIASAGNDGSVRLWLPTLRRSSGLSGPCASGGGCVGSGGENCYMWRAHEGPVRALAASPYNDYLYTAGDDKAVKCWDLNYVPSKPSSSGKSSGHKFVSGFVGGHQNWVRTVAVSSGANMLPSHTPLVASGGDDRTVQIWDTRSRKPTCTFYEHTNSVRSVDFHPDGCSIATGSSDCTINVYDLRICRLLQHYDAHDGGVNEVRFAPTGSWLVSASTDGTAKLWDLKEGHLYCTLSAHEGGVHTSRFSDDSQYLVTAGQDSLVMLWRSGILQTKPVCATSNSPESFPTGGANTGSLPVAAVPLAGIESDCRDAMGNMHLIESSVLCRERAQQVSAEPKAKDTCSAHSRRSFDDPLGTHRSKRVKKVKIGAVEPKGDVNTACSLASSQNSAVSSQRPPLAQPSSQAGGSAAIAAMVAPDSLDDCPFSTCLRDDTINGVESRRTAAQAFSCSECKGDAGMEPLVGTSNGAGDVPGSRGGYCVAAVNGGIKEKRFQFKGKEDCLPQQQPPRPQSPSYSNVPAVVHIEGNLCDNASNVGEERGVEEEMSVMEYVDIVCGGGHTGSLENCVGSVKYHEGHSPQARKGNDGSINDRLSRLEEAYACLADEVRASQIYTAEVVERQQHNWELQRQQQRSEMEQIRAMMEGLVAQQSALLEALRKVR